MLRLIQINLSIHRKRQEFESFDRARSGTPSTPKRLRTTWRRPRDACVLRPAPRQDYTRERAASTLTRRPRRRPRPKTHGSVWRAAPPLAVSDPEGDPRWPGSGATERTAAILCVSARARCPGGPRTPSGFVCSCRIQSARRKALSPGVFATRWSGSLCFRKKKQLNARKLFSIDIGLHARKRESIAPPTNDAIAKRFNRFSRTLSTV